MSNFTKAIERELDGIDHISPGLASCCGECCSAHDLSETEMEEDLSSGLVFDEGGFSRQSCDSCGSTLAGNRYAAHGFSGAQTEGSDKSLVHLDICEDCLLFHANGDEPDTWE